MTRHDMLASLLRKKAALTYKDPAVVAAMDAARPAQQARWSPFTMDGKEKGQTAPGKDTYSLKVPSERRAVESVRQLVDETAQADRTRYENEDKEWLAGQAQLEGEAPVGVHLADYDKRRTELEKANRDAARDRFYGNWKGDYNRTPDEIYEELAQSRYTDSRWQAAKNMVRRLLGSTDKDAQRTYKNWRGYDREKIRNSLLGASQGAGFWDARQGEDSDLDRLRAAAYARWSGDRAARSAALKQERERYEATMPTGMRVSNLPGEYVRYATDKDGNVVQTTARNTHPYVTKDQAYAGARDWANRVAEALHALPGSRANSLLVPALTQYANGTYQGIGQGRTLQEILESQLTPEEFQQVIDNFRNSTASPSDYTLARLLNSRY